MKSSRMGSAPSIATSLELTRDDHGVFSGVWREARIEVDETRARLRLFADVPLQLEVTAHRALLRKHLSIRGVEAPISFALRLELTGTPELLRWFSRPGRRLTGGWLECPLPAGDAGAIRETVRELSTLAAALRARIDAALEAARQIDPRWLEKRFASSRRLIALCAGLIPPLFFFFAGGDYRNRTPFEDAVTFAVMFLEVALLVTVWSVARCPACERSLVPLEILRGKVSACPHCDARLVAPEESPDPQ